MIFKLSKKTEKKILILKWWELYRLCIRHTDEKENLSVNAYPQPRATKEQFDHTDEKENLSMNALIHMYKMQRT